MRQLVIQINHECLRINVNAEHEAGYQEMLKEQWIDPTNALIVLGCYWLVKSKIDFWYWRDKPITDEVAEAKAEELKQLQRDMMKAIVGQIKDHNQTEQWKNPADE